MTPKCIDNQRNLRPVETAFWFRLGLFHKGRELRYKGYRRGTMKILGVNENMCILYEAKIPKPKTVFPRHVVSDQVRIFNDQGGLTVTATLDLDEWECGNGDFIVASDIHLTR